MAQTPGYIQPRRIDPAAVVDTETFSFREVAAVAALAESIVRAGQREPIDVRPVPGGFQLLSGHRRLQAARMLRRDAVSARIHEGLSDDEALHLALADDLDRRCWTAAERARLRLKLEGRGPLPAAVEALLRRADAQAPLEPSVAWPAIADESLDLDVRARAVRDRLADACNDLATLFERWDFVDDERRSELIACVRYLKEMHPFLAASEEEEP